MHRCRLYITIYRDISKKGSEYICGIMDLVGGSSHSSLLYGLSSGYLLLRSFSEGGEKETVLGIAKSQQKKYSENVSHAAKLMKRNLKKE